MNVRIAKRAARILATVLVLSIILSVSAVSASAYEVKGRTLAQALGMDGAVYYSWLRSHINDTYYNTTPYEHADHRNPNGDCQGANGTLDTPGVPALNCMGFVWHALYMPTKMSGGSTGLIPSYGNGGWYGLYTGYNLSRRYFNSKRDLLKSGYAEPGDIIWMFEVNETVADDSNHIAIYMGDGHSDRVWHAVKAGTKFGYINPDYAEYLVIKSGAVRTLKAPKLKSIANAVKGPRLTWCKVSGAQYYRVYVKNGKTWKLLGQTSNNYFDDKTAKSGKTYTYTVRCVERSGKSISPLAKNGLSIAYYAAPGGFKAEFDTTTGVKFTWNAVAGAAKYRVLRSTNGKDFYTIGTTAGTSFVDKKAVPGKSYYYTVRVVNSKGKMCSAYRTPLKGYFVNGVPKLTSAVTDNSGLTLGWNAMKGADQYVIYQKYAGTGWKRVGVTNKTKLLIKKPVKDAEVKYTIRCMNKSGNAFTSASDKSGFTAVSLDPPKMTRMEALADGVKLTYSASALATRFNIYRKNDKGVWAKIGASDTNTFIDATAVPGKTYTYTLRSVAADKKSTTSGFNTKGWAMKYVATPQITATATATGINLSWGKNAGATNYRVFVKKDGKWTTVANTTGTSYEYTDVENGTEYTLTVRCIDSRKWFNSFYNTEGVTATYIDPEAPQPVTEGQDPPAGDLATVQSGTDATQAIEPVSEFPTVEPTTVPSEQPLTESATE